ncbi:MAG: biopolymer transporter ExbD [Verrucomicrobia bacterium]|nr:biopolymer transporter ExbD [Verrucomicrobiota bacterium]
MKFGSLLPHKKARIEIIPLIDIMFFLLASFMMVSLTMVKMKSLKMDLPTATEASRDFKPDVINIDIDDAGRPHIDLEPKTLAEVFAHLTNRLNVNTNLPVYIHGDRNASHGSVVAVLDLVRKAGVLRVSFASTPPERPRAAASP